MAPVYISLMFGAGAAAYVWGYLARTTGYARTGSTVGGALVVGVIAFVVLYTILKFAFNLQ